MSRAAVFFAARAGGLATCALMLVAAGQPIFTDDAWWHLALGRAFAASGVPLGDDPLLFAAAGPAQTGSWLWDVALWHALSLGGFAGLRALHVALVAAILALAWSQLRRASASAALASLGTAAFVALAAYRLVQLRPHLFTMLALLVLHRLLVEPGARTSVGRIALAVALVALWANVHASFPLAFVLLGAAAVGCALASLGEGAEGPQRARALGLAAALVLALVASLANPSGVDALRPYFVAGSETPALAAVVDEWRPAEPWRLPVPTLPPSPLAWALFWGIGLALAASLARAARAAPGDRPDPSEVGPALAGVALPLVAVRFLWLGLFPLLLVGHALRARHGAAWLGPAAAVASLGVALAFVRCGDWPVITRGLPTTWSGYWQPYPVEKYFAESIWWLADAGLSGNLYTEYPLAGFANFWLAPRIRTLANGTLNFSPDAAQALGAIADARGARPGESLEALLDRLGVDLFLGVRPPEVGHAVRPWASTLAHLDGADGWIPVFRSLDSAVYLRANQNNRENLARAARYYAERGVPFDERRGFDVAAALRAAPGWCVAHGLVPAGFVRSEHAARFGGSVERHVQSDRVAALYAVLGLYEEAVALDRATLRDAPDDVRARRRLVWSLLRLRRFAEAADAAAPLAGQPEEDGLSHHLVEAADTIGGLDEPERSAALARLPFLARVEVPWLLAGVRGPPVRDAAAAPRMPRE